MKRRLFLLAAVGCLAACGGGDETQAAATVASSSSASTGGGGAGGAGGSGGAAAVEVVFDLEADTSQSDHFYDRPFPSDARVNAKGAPDYAGFPMKPNNALVTGLLSVVSDHVGAPVMPVVYFKFTGAIAAQDVTKVIAADAKSNVLLVDLEDNELVPTIADTPATDPYVPENMLAVAPRPGFILLPNHHYGFVVRSGLGDANGKPLGVAKTMGDIASGKTDEGDLYAPLFASLAALSIDKSDVVAATVITTGDVVQDLADISSGLLAKYSVTIDGLAVDHSDDALQDRFCALKGTIDMPQFQQGTPPYDQQGLFDFSDGGLPAKQGTVTIPVTLTLPKGPMPDMGYPLVLFFHGSGGYSTQVVDRGTWVPTMDASTCSAEGLEVWNGVTGCNQRAGGPAFVLAPFGFGAAGGALPVNPERLPGASEIAYINVNNLAEGRDLFREGVIEQRLFLDALTKLQIDPSVVASCTGLSLPMTATSYNYDASHLYAQGQSMGGQYTNMFSAVEPRILGAVPTGAGGYWSYFVTHTSLMGGSIPGLVGTIIGTAPGYDHLHPALQLFETVWEPVDPMVYMPRVGRRPLPGAPVRPIYEPVGEGDSYFPEATYDAASLAYGHKEAGEIIWSSMQDALKLEKLDGLVSYPVTNDLTSSDGNLNTGVIIQYQGDGVYDPHSIFTQLDAVKYQYGCFLSTLYTSGVATVPAPAALGTPCPN